MNRIVCGLLGLSLLWGACQQPQNEHVITDTPSSGTIHISVDESFEPVIEQQTKVYESSYPNAYIIAKYEPEVDCF
jgi:phosphate transport system substrate-binding protein